MSADALVAPDQTVYEALKKAILSRRLPPGTKLTEEKLSAIFKVSRERVRKVIQRLAHDKCVDLFPNRGAFVAQPGVDEAKQVFEARRFLEPHLVDLVAANALPQDLIPLQANVTTEREQHQHGEFQEAIATSGDFHVLLAAAAGNQVLAGILKDLVERSSLVIAMYGESRFDLCGVDEHEEILTKLRAGQVGRARKLLLDHLQAIEDGLRFDRSGTPSVDLAEILDARTP